MQTVEQVRALATVVHSPGDMGATISSGSFLTEGMVTHTLDNFIGSTLKICGDKERRISRVLQEVRELCG